MGVLTYSSSAWRLVKTLMVDLSWQRATPACWVFLEVWIGAPLAGYSFGLQIGKLRCYPESAPGTFLELLQSWLVRHGLSEIMLQTDDRPTGPGVGGWRGPTENCCTDPNPRRVSDNGRVQLFPV